MRELFKHFDNIKENDPDFWEIFNNFAFNEVFENSNLSQKDCILVILATLIANRSKKAFKIFIKNILDLNIAPVEIKELLYQSVPYVGFAKAGDFFNTANKVFSQKGIVLPLKSQSTTDVNTRYEKGRKVQDDYFGKENMDLMRDGTPNGQQHFNKFLEGYCFGDFYTRTGLDDKQRELITFTLIASLGGCENQLRGHTQGNLSVGNSKEKLIDTLTVIMPYIGFPRTLNALGIVNEVCE